MNILTDARDTRHHRETRNGPEAELRPGRMVETPEEIGMSQDARIHAIANRGEVDPPRSTQLEGIPRMHLDLKRMSCISGQSVSLIASGISVCTLVLPKSDQPIKSILEAPTQIHGFQIIIPPFRSTKGQIWKQ